MTTKSLKNFILYYKYLLFQLQIRIMVQQYKYKKGNSRIPLSVRSREFNIISWMMHLYINNSYLYEWIYDSCIII